MIAFELAAGPAIGRCIALATDGDAGGACESCAAESAGFLDGIASGPV